MGPSISISESGNLNFVQEAIKGLQQARVYVGIPEIETSRTGEPITNAALMYIHTNGSQLMHIPARPVIEPALETSETKTKIEEFLAAGGNAYLDGNKDKARTFFAMAGTVGSNASKRWFTDPRNGWAQNSPRTIRNKLRVLKGKAHFDAMSVLDSVTKFMPVFGTSQLDQINTPLIDKGELRRAITYVVSVK